MGLLAALTPHVLPGTRSIGSNWSPLLPARSHTAGGYGEPSPGFAVSDNLTQWDPYSGGDGNALLAAGRPIPVGDSPAPLPARPAVGMAYVTPSALWNIAGPGGFDQGDWPIVRKGPGGSRYYQFGFHTPGQQPFEGGGGAVKRSTPSVPPPMPFLGSGL